MFRFLFLGIFLVLINSLQAQQIVGIATKWNDEFSEWTIFTDDEEVEGELIRRWQMRDDWTEWDYRIGEESGSIRMSWKNDPSQWEIRGYDDIITARMLWTNDIREWRLTNNDITIIIRSKYGNALNEWEVRKEDHGYFGIHSHWEDDPREWRVIDELDEEISVAMRMALIFIPLYHSTPKW